MDLFTVDNVGEAELLLDQNNEANAVKFNSTINILDGVASTPTEELGDIEEDDNMSDLDFGDLPRNTIDISHIIKRPPLSEKSELQRNMEKFCKMLEKVLEANEKDTQQMFDDENTDNFGKVDVKKELKTCETMGIEKQKSLELLSEKQRTKKGREERAKSKGKNWFNLPATEMSDEVKNDLEIIQMRSVLDPKHFYKKNDLKVLPKYFQVGKVLPSPLDYYNERGTRKTKRKTLVDELMDDAQFQRFNKRKYAEIMEEKKRSGYHKANKKMKKLKKNKS